AAKAPVLQISNSIPTNPPLRRAKNFILVFPRLVKLRIFPEWQLDAKRTERGQNSSGSAGVRGVH
ncbi:MAG: hypothetical protein ABIP64_13765, partial [Burkholderiales bacterium]